MSIIVYSPGRTGSTLISQAMANKFKLPVYSTELNRNYLAPSDSIIHTHNPLFFTKENRENNTVVISYRRNLFDTVISKLISNYTLEYTSYTNKEVSISITETEFCNMYYFCKCFYKLIDLSKFDVVIYVEFEELIANPLYLFSKFGEASEMNYNTQKSSYTHSVISNIDYCKTLFSQLEQNIDITDIIAIVKSNLEEDFPLI